MFNNEIESQCSVRGRDASLVAENHFSWSDVASFNALPCPMDAWCMESIEPAAVVEAVICVGDSIRMGYEPTVVVELQGWAEVIEMGDTQGGTTRNVLEHLEEWVIAHNPDIVHLNAGLHDMARASGPGPENRVPVDEYRANLRQIVETILQKTDARVIVALTTPVDLERQLAVEYGINRTLEDVALYNNVATTIAAELGVTVNDLFNVIADHGAGELLAEDGVHFTPEGSAIIGRAAAAAIRAVVEE